MRKLEILILLFISWPSLTSETTSGYLEIEPKKSLFYTLTPQEQTAKEVNHRLIFWTNGGPGVSSLMCFFGGVGPLNANDYGTVSPNPYSFTYLGDLVTIDQPYGTGLSNTNIPKEDPEITGYEKVAEILSDFFVLFLKKNPKYRDYEIIFAGESMSGFFLPKAVLKFKQKQNRLSQEISLFLVSPWIDSITHYSEFVNFALLNKIVDPSYESMLVKEQSRCIEGLKIFEKITVENVQNCYDFTDLITQKSLYRRYDISIKAEPGSDAAPKVKDWSKFEENLKNGKLNNYLGLKSNPIDYQRSNSAISQSLMVPSSMSALEDIKIAVAKNIQVAVVSGRLDLVSNFLSARKWISGVESSFSMTSESFESGINKVVASKASEGIKQYEIADAGHTVSYKQPQALYLVLQDFLVRKEGKVTIVTDK